MTAASWRPGIRNCLGLLVFLAGAQLAQAAPAPAIAPAAYEISQLARQSGRAYVLTARVGVYNTGTLARNLTGTLTGGVGEFVILDGAVRFGDVARTDITQPCLSRDTFRIRFVLPSNVHPDRSWEYAHELMSGLSWQLACANCGTNRPPIANAGPDQSAFVQQLVTLDGSGSSDPDGHAITYAWSIVTRPAGSTAALVGATNVSPTLTPDREGDYTVQLIVHDGRVASAPDTVVISTLNSAPVANAGPDQTAFVSQRVQLDGSASSDVDGDPLTYAWEVAQRPAASTAAIDRPAEVNPTFAPDAPGEYLIELIVDDGTVSSAPDTMIISTLNSRPVADAGADQTVRVGDTAALDGSASSDADGDPLTYRWSLSSRPTSSTASLQGETSPNPTLPIDRAGTYVAQLIVNDGQSDSDADTVAVSTVNSPPAAVPGANQTVHFGATVRLDGSGSSDPDGDGLTFAWALLTVPESSTASLSDAGAIAPSFVADRPGTYVVQLIVNDGTVNSAPASLTVTGQNAVPVARDDVATTAAGTAVTVDVLDNDTDADAEDTLRVSSVTQPANGAATFTATDVTYTPNTGFSGSDTFTYRATDGADFASASVVVTVAAPTNRPPVANAGPDQSLPAGSQVTLDGTQSSDPDGDPLSYAWELRSRPAGSSAALDAATSATPRFTADRRGSYEAALTVSDGRGGSATDSVTIVALNRNPIAVADSASTAANTAVTIDVLANDTDPDGDPLAIGSVTQPTGGTVQIVGSSLRFTPLAGTSGTVTFSYTIDDGNGGTATAVVSVSVEAPPAVLLSIDDVSVTEGNAGTTAVAFTVTQSAVSTTATTFSFTTVDDSAVSPADYVATAGTAQIAAGATSVEITVTVNGDTQAEPDERLFVRLSNAVNATIGDAEGILDIVNDDGGAPTSLELIGAALRGGLIDDETALLYSVYAELQDPRLPAQYVGRAETFFEGAAIREAATRFETLTPATQAILAPELTFPDLFELPVDAPGPASGFADRTAALSPGASLRVMELVPGRVRMAWDENSPLAFVLEERANALRAEFNARIWPRLTVAFGPLVAGRILILLDDAPGVSYEDVSADCTVARIWLREHHPVVFAHELTHALIDLNYSIAACNDDEKLWMHEATATWAQHYVYPPANQGREHNAAPFFLTRTDEPLSTYERSTRGHQYGAYLWFLRLAGQGNNPGIVRAMWEAGAGVTSLEAIESTLRGSGLGGFEEQWPGFARDNWNREPPHRKYKDWDGMSHKASQAEFNASLGGAGFLSVELGYDLPFLTASYQRWNFTGDASIRRIAFQNGNAGSDPNLSIQAIVKIRNQPWGAAEDWTNREERFFCRDTASEDVEEVIIIVAHRGFNPADARIQDRGNFNLDYSAIPCSDWTGSTTYTGREELAGGGFEQTTANTQGLRFRLDLTENRNRWVVVAGTVNVSYESVTPFEDGSCRATAATTLPANGQLFVFPVGNELRYFGADIPVTPVPPTITQTIVCRSSSGEFTIVQDVPFFGVAWFNTGPNLWPLEPGATTLQGSNPPTGPARDRWTWNLQRAQ